MECKLGRDVIGRCEPNPIIKLKDVPFRCSDVWNAGVARIGDQVLLLLTIETLEGRCNIYPARSDDGIDFTVEAKPFMVPVQDGPYRPYEHVSVRDARITPMDGGYYITYLAEGDHGLRVGLARTEDFRSVRRMGYVSQVDVKSGALFPRKIDGQYVLLKRPDAGRSIWLSRSPDLEFWGEDAPVLTPRGGYWDSTRVGAAAPPIEIDAGWLLIYYGEKDTSAGPLTRLGAAILDRDDPSRVLLRSNIPILAPREKYERIGDVPNLVFSCGALLENGIVQVYYGASDSCICVGTAALKQIVRVCIESQREF